MKILDTCDRLNIFEEGFSLKQWQRYIDSFLYGKSHIFIDDIKGYDFKCQCLPIINSCLNDKPAIAKTRSSFKKVTNDLENILNHRFHPLDTDIILYLGLCNGAGWVTKIDGKSYILLGIEKIIELKWFDLSDMYGLIYHELGHVYQDTYGILERDLKGKDKFMWQLFTEGVAMYFEQELLNDHDFYHQDKNGWKKYLSDNIDHLKKDFYNDIVTMTDKDQRYFGDWTAYDGHGDAGYYLGTIFVMYILRYHSFDEILSFDIDTVNDLYIDFLNDRSSTI